MATTWLQAANNVLTTLAADLVAGATTIDITSTALMPTSYPFRLTIWNSELYGFRNPWDDPDMEIIEVTGANPYGYGYPYYGGGPPGAGDDEYQIIRAREGTADIDHQEGDTVALLITAGMIQQIQQAIAVLEGP